MSCLWLLKDSRLASLRSCCLIHEIINVQLFWYFLVDFNSRYFPLSIFLFQFLFHVMFHSFHKSSFLLFLEVLFIERIIFKRLESGLLLLNEFQIFNIVSFAIIANIIYFRLCLILFGKYRIFEKSLLVIEVPIFNLWQVFLLNILLNVLCILNQLSFHWSIKFFFYFKIYQFVL